MKLTGAEEENKAGLGGSRDQKVTTQKTPSFKDKKKVQNWFQRQFSRNMSHDYDSTEMEHATAVAAAAFAIFAHDSQIPQQKKTREPSLTKAKSKLDDTKPPIYQFGSTSKRSSGSFKSSNDQGNKAAEDLRRPERTMSPAPSMRRNSTLGEKLKGAIDDKKPVIQAPKRTPTFADEHTAEIKPETPPPIVPLPVYEPVSLRPPPPPPPVRQNSNSARPSARETKADTWEREELEKIKERYEKLLETIDSWEKRKKMKARRKLNKHEQSENERKRMKASKKFEEKLDYINQIAGGARAQAEERRRNEVLKAKEKANIIRTTGKIPGPCSCF